MGREALTLTASTTVSRHNSPQDDVDNCRWNKFARQVKELAEENELFIDVSAEDDLPTDQWTEKPPYLLEIYVPRKTFRTKHLFVGVHSTHLDELAPPLREHVRRDLTPMEWVAMINALQVRETFPLTKGGYVRLIDNDRKETDAGSL